MQILNRWTGDVIHEADAESMKLLVLSAIGKQISLRGSDLSGSNLRGSDLSGSNLSGSDLSGSDLSGSNLSGSNLSGSDLSGSNLSGSDLTPIRDDFWAVLSSVPSEVTGLRAKLISGEINGSTYTGVCACLVGTIAKARNCRYDEIPGLSPNASRPIEKFFTEITPGKTPENCQPAKLVLEWLDTWFANMTAAFGVKS